MVQQVKSELKTVLVDPGHSEPVRFGKYILPKSFSAWFIFSDKSKVWDIVFEIRVSDEGVPSLYKVEILGSRSRNLLEQGRESVKRWQLQRVEQERFNLLETALKVAICTRVPAYMPKEEYSPEAVAMRALNKVIPNINPLELEPLPAGFIRYWDGNPNPLNAQQIKELTKEIDTRIRKRIDAKYLKRIAKIYTDAVNEGKNPIEAIMESESVKHRTASEYATKARAPELKLLPVTTPGKVTITRQKRKGSK